ncbi:hypothetical protein F8O01_05355 [Pseudoclavibacter chungangensis]|uniref:DUF3322 and DUF2220 domain-containing protein n=1 Tax=Pseudoclavibacter chungangensis TaxID=587635 RepID=A0A7J5C0K2_9MICO|nr:Wadjet anti-phage system protein JetD domain-containing protein [Pseudoclavibacter chungangensis]KAB1659684.1 hypothetical protein F8O01_05355 [Pseudoclavibacter chungangensis]NYJ67523.1 hypothetical protein [Pseudoclavibacter chungangensis]
MSAPVSVDRLRERARRLLLRDGNSWAATGDEAALLELPLHPPSERAALADPTAARAWTDSWLRAASELPIEVSWISRNWARLGAQELPERVVVRGPGRIAAVAGTAQAHDWLALRDRLLALRELIGPGDDVVLALRSHARTIAALSSTDVERLHGVLRWLRDNPASGRAVRELPIRGVHTKWIEARRGLVEALHRLMSNEPGLGLREPTPLVRMRVLDERLAPGGLTDLSVPVDDLAALPLRPERVFVFENLASVLAMPPVPGAVVLDGGGHRVHLIARLPWAQEVTYWGDLDSHGFAILHRLRALGVRSTSALMDTETLLAHRDLWVAEDSPSIAALPLLTGEEEATLRRLGSEGNVRLEQERIPWPYALARLGIA